MDNNNSITYNGGVSAKKVISEIFRHPVFIVITFAVCILLSLGYSFFMVTPMYSSEAKIYVKNQATSQDQKISTAELQISTLLTQDCSELILDRAVLDEVNRQLNLPYGYSQLRRNVSVVANEDTRFIRIIVTTDDAMTSKKIADKICDVSKEKIVELLGIDWVKVIDGASMPASPSGKSVLQYVAYGLIVAVIICAVYIAIMYYKNDKISGAEDAEQILGLCTLATIPYNNGKNHR